MARAKLREIAEAAIFDPKQAILNALGDSLDDVEIFHNLVLVATYIGPEKTAGGIIRPDRTLLEDRFQGKVGLVVKMGPLAFKDDNIAKFGGVDLQLHDWVLFKAGDGWEFFSVDSKDGGTPCRLFEDTMIKGRTRDPALIY